MCVTGCADPIHAATSSIKEGAHLSFAAGLAAAQARGTAAAWRTHAACKTATMMMQIILMGTDKCGDG
jgi:hypothetical protein